MAKVVLDSGLRIHYQRVGRGPDVVMIHGLTGNLAVWHFRIIPLLADHHRVLTYDLRGHGYSDMPPTGYSPTDMVEDLRGLLDAVGIERAALVGHSYGGDIALYFARRYPNRVRQVVAIEAVLPALVDARPEDHEAKIGHWADVLEAAGFPVPPEKRFDTDYLIRQSLLVPKKWGPLNGLPRNPEPFLRLLDTTTFVRDYEDTRGLTVESIRDIAAPVTLMYVEGSSFLNSCRALMERLPDCSTILLPRTDWGHFGPLEQPDLVAQHLRSILDDGVGSAQRTEDAADLEPSRSA